MELQEEHVKRIVDTINKQTEHLKELRLGLWPETFRVITSQDAGQILQGRGVIDSIIPLQITSASEIQISDNGITICHFNIAAADRPITGMNLQFDIDIRVVISSQPVMITGRLRK